MLITKMPVNCMPKDNHKLLLFKIVGSHIRKIWKHSSGIYCPDKTMTKRSLRGEWERGFCIALPAVISFKIPTEISLKIAGKDSTSPAGHLEHSYFWVGAWVSGFCDSMTMATVMSTTEFQYRNINFWSGVWANLEFCFLVVWQKV